MTVYGYARISRKQQSIERQIRNILSEYPKAIIKQEAYTGTTTDRPEWNKLYKRVKDGDTIVFDSVSRMSRNAEEGIKTYFELYNRGVNLVFLKERHIDTDAYKNALESSGIKTDKVDGTAEGTLVKEILDAINRFMKVKASDDIVKAFEQAEKEVQDLRQRTREGIETARLNGEQIGQRKGAKLNVKKSAIAKGVIKRHCKDFGGELNDIECIKLTGLSRNTYYKYKREIRELED